MAGANHVIIKGMAYLVTKTKDDCFAQLKVLIKAFAKQYAGLKKSAYKEDQLRADFLNPLLKTFGWDIENESSKSQFIRDVLQEESIDVIEDEQSFKKNPDYTLRIQGIRKLFIEAKKVSVDIEKSSAASFQTRRYGWNANMGISILTNFEKLIVYDCRSKPNSTDNPAVGRYKVFDWQSFESQFDEIYELLSYEFVASGSIDEYFSISHPEATPFDKYFLEQIERWRRQLANDVISRNAGLNEKDINFLIQHLLNRIIFIRICEDRAIETPETLRDVSNYMELKQLFVKADKKYNAGLFDFIEDQFSLNIDIDANILIEIFRELYYPESPYDFSIVDPTILSQIYERYLGSTIKLLPSGAFEDIVELPEIAASNGVVPTPKLIVETIVRETLTPLLTGKTFEELRTLKIADICCGSGTFLISTYDLLIRFMTEALIKADIDDDKLIYKSFDGDFHLRLGVKQSVLLENIYGVDINPYAVEVSKFSLFLKLLENENEVTVAEFMADHAEKLLPKLENNLKTGNSLIDNNYFSFNPRAIHDNSLLFKIKPFDWIREFPFIKRQGFDAIVGNPPFVRIQNMIRYIPEETKYYQSGNGNYFIPKDGGFDKYYLFLQRAIELTSVTGIIGYIVPNKFFVLAGGSSLREFLVSHGSLSKIIHFGVTQVFPGRLTYTAIMIIEKTKSAPLQFKRIHKVTETSFELTPWTNYSNTDFTEKPWIFLSAAVSTLFNRIRSMGTLPLDDLVEIVVGVQTSADPVFIFFPHQETNSTFIFKNKAGENREIEKGICKPLLYKKSFELFDTIEADAQVIFPYRIQNDRATAYTEDEMKANFPLTWNYLNQNKEKLSRRSINGKDALWYEFGRRQGLTKFFNQPKIIWPVLSKEPKYVYDTSDILSPAGGNGPFYSLISHSSYSPLYFLGILSHPVFEGMIKAGASEFQGAYYSHGKQFIENLPIYLIDFLNESEKEKHDLIVETVSLLIKTKKDILSEYNSEAKEVLWRKFYILQEKLISEVNTLYNITPPEMAIVSSDDLFKTELEED